jgi:hypothetical protein
LTSSEFVMGDHHFSLQVLADDPPGLLDARSQDLDHKELNERRTAITGERRSRCDSRRLIVPRLNGHAVVGFDVTDFLDQETCRTSIKDSAHS